MSDNVYSIKFKSGRAENRGYTLESRRQLSSFKSYFHFRFDGRHLEFLQSAIVDQRHPTSADVLGDKAKSALVKNLEAAVGIASQSTIV